MVKSGVTLRPECMEVFNEYKFKSKYDYIIMRLSEDSKSVVVTDKPPKGTYLNTREFKASTLDNVGPFAPDCYKCFYETLTKEDKCGYGIYLFDYREKGLGVTTTLSLITWIPDTTQIKPKMLYSSTKDEVKKKLGLEQNSIQLSDLKDFDYRQLLADKVTKKEVEFD